MEVVPDFRELAACIMSLSEVVFENEDGDAYLSALGRR